MKKTRLLWNLIDEKSFISADRNLRFRKGKQEKVIERIYSNDFFYKDVAITFGDYVVVSHGVRGYDCVIGQVVGFSRNSETKSKKKFPFSFCIFEVNQNVMMTLSPCYAVQIDRLEHYVNVTTSVKSYKCTVGKNALSLQNLKLNYHAVSVLKKFLK